MKPTRYMHPLSLAEIMRHHMNESFISDRLDSSHCGQMTAANIVEDEHGYRIEMPVPGMTREDFEIVLEKKLLSIKSREDDKNDEQKYLRKEFCTTSVNRSFSISERIDVDAIKASCTNGILRVELPVRAEDLKLKQRREIEVA